MVTNGLSGKNRLLIGHFGIENDLCGRAGVSENSELLFFLIFTESVYRVFRRVCFLLERKVDMAGRVPNDKGRLYSGLINYSLL